MLKPTLVVRNVARLDTVGNKELVSCSFIATFDDKSSKIINVKSWQPVGLVPDWEFGEVHLSPDECTLYHKDWKNKPLFSSDLAFN